MKTSNSPIYASHAMECGRQTYKGLSDIVDRFASDQQLWSGKFLEAWDLMATNGYTSLRPGAGPGPGWFTDLEEGPQAGWLGHYSLDKAGRLEGGVTLESLIAGAGEAGLVWTDDKVDDKRKLDLQSILDRDILFYRLTQPSVDIKAIIQPLVLSLSPTALTSTLMERHA